MTQKTTRPILSSALCLFAALSPLVINGLVSRVCLAQDTLERARINSSIGRDGTGTIIVEAHGQLPEPTVFYSASATCDATVGAELIEQVTTLSIKVIQGNASTLSFGLRGEGDVAEVRGTNLRSWSVRQVGSERFLDLQVERHIKDLTAELKLRSPRLSLPATTELLHLSPGDSVGFALILNISYTPGVKGIVTEAIGFAPLAGSDVDASQGDAPNSVTAATAARGQTNRFQSATGGQITLSLSRDGASPAPVELVETSLKGGAHPNGKSVHFQLRGTARVSKPNAEFVILSGNAAIRDVPTDVDFRLRLAQHTAHDVYKLVFAKAGTFPVVLDFVAPLGSPGAGWQGMDFTISAGAIVPIELRGLDANLEFHRDQESVVPLRDHDTWIGFLPATGRAKLQWKASRKAGEGKLFFTTTGQVETRVGAGLMRQDHQIDYQVLQGELNSFSIRLQGPGEILDVQGDNIVSWKVSEKGADRQLDAILSQPITGVSRINVRSQTPVGAFPVRSEGLRLSPIGAIRHSGYLRLTNWGSVRLEPTGLSGLTQLAPDQFPGEPIEARQIFVYRFPGVDHTFTVAADRIQPEVNISELVLYEISETDRAINADVELDVREAPIREWDFSIPADYSVVSVAGASVADYIAASDVADGRRNLRVLFGQDVAGRQLITLHLEKSEAATEGDWLLPRIEFPGAKNVRGDIGIMGAPGFRVVVREADLLVEKPLAYFPKPMANLQQAFRVRERNWSAVMHIELLERSVQTDVFHLYSLSEETVFGSAIINSFVTGSPVSEWRIAVPAALGNVTVDGQDIRTWRREGDTLMVSLHQPVMGAYTLLVTFEEKPNKDQGSFRPGQVTPIGVQGERGYIQVVSPVQVEINTESISKDILELDPLELPAEFRLLSTSPPLGTWQYTERPFELKLNVNWFQPGSTVTQVVEFSEANSRVSQDGELVTDVTYFVKTRGQRTLKIKLPEAPVRLWEVAVNGQPVTARQAADATLIPLPGGTDPNLPVEVRLRLGKPTVNESRPRLTLPVVDAPVLKTQWHVVGDEKHVLVPKGGTVTPPVPVLRPSGFNWVAKRGTVPLMLIGLFTGIGIWSRRQTPLMQAVGLLGLAIAIGICLSTASSASSQNEAPLPLRLSLPILAAGELIELQVKNTPLWRANLSWIGLAALVGGLAGIVRSLTRTELQRPLFNRWGGILLIALGLLLQGDGAAPFYVLLALAILLVLFLPAAISWLRYLSNSLQRIVERRNEKKRTADATPSKEVGSATPTILLFAVMVAAGGVCSAEVPDGFSAADSVKQNWHITHGDARLDASGTMTLSGQPGDRFLLLRGPAVLTRFEGEGLRLTKLDVIGEGLSYIVSIPVPEAAHELADGSAAETATVDYTAAFDFQLESVNAVEGIPVPTGTAAVQEISLRYDEPGWAVSSPAAAQIETIDAAEATLANILLGPTHARLFLKPKARDVTTEETQFFVEGSNLYLPGPGVVDGRHQLHIRTSQGQVNELNVLVPQGMTVSAVNGPVGSWQFDADRGGLTLEIEPPRSQAFDVIIETQRGLSPLPTDVDLAPVKVAGANGEVGLIAIAFGPDAQPEKVESNQMSSVNLGDFDASLLPSPQAVLHRVYRYGADGGQLAVRVSPVTSEVRVTSKEALSLGDERIVLGVNFEAEISRTGLFQLSFPLPDGLEVESLTGDALHHWAELTDGDERQIILHLNGKTIGTHSFALAMSGLAPTDAAEWDLPQFQLTEATRQTGELVVRPTTGIRLRTVSRKNVSETDPRTMGGEAQGSLAFRILQRDWSLRLGIEKLEPWITGQVLHEVTLREGQTRSTMIANFNVQNASIRALRVVLPITAEDERKTLRASGNAVSDFVRTAPDSNTWEVQFKRRVVGKCDFQIEYERRGERENENEKLTPAIFPQARQLAYYFSVRAGGRLELEHDAFSEGWQRVDWNTIPTTLRDVENRNAPVFALRAVTPANALVINARRHSLADALKLRVAEAELTTVLSPTGDQLTAVEMTTEVIQRSSLSVGLPAGAEIFSIFVNGESVNSIRQEGKLNAWQFYILPGIDDRTAKVRFVYSVVGDRLNSLTLTSPELNVPLENIAWNVVVPEGFELTDNDGNLELLRQTSQQTYDRGSYLSKVSGKRQVQAQQAAQLLEQAGDLLQAGEQTKARWALNSVANQHALDAASNEDARVQLQNLQTQQAVVGLNTRRQRLYLDHNRDDTAFVENQQLWEAATDNPILKQDQLNFRPQQLSQLLRGNTTADNAVLQQIAGRLVQHQHATEPTPQAIIVSLPVEGVMYTFGRSVQVTENEPLELKLNFGLQRRLQFWQTALALTLLSAIAATFTLVTTRPEAA